jgi:hypothetical protein
MNTFLYSRIFRKWHTVVHSPQLLISDTCCKQMNWCNEFWHLHTIIDLLFYKILSENSRTFFVKIITVKSWSFRSMNLPAVYPNSLYLWLTHYRLVEK